MTCYSYIDKRNVSDNRLAIIEAQAPDGGQWDSDLVGSESMSYAEAREYVAAAVAGQSQDDSDWSGYSLRIVVEDEDGCYRLVVDGSEIDL